MRSTKQTCLGTQLNCCVPNTPVSNRKNAYEANPVAQALPTTETIVPIIVTSTTFFRPTWSDMVPQKGDPIPNPAKNNEAKNGAFQASSQTRENEAVTVWAGLINSLRREM